MMNTKTLDNFNKKRT